MVARFVFRKNTDGGAALSENQARNILARHVAKLNPELKFGPDDDREEEGFSWLFFSRRFKV